MLFCCLSTIIAMVVTQAGTPDANFSFLTREGSETTLRDEIARLQPDAAVRLLLFDPDCGECRSLIGRLETDTVFNSGLADRSTAVIAIFPVDETLPPDDPNLIAYRQICHTFPGDWVVGIDNGSIFKTDACQWECLPLLLEFRANEFHK